MNDAPLKNWIPYKLASTETGINCSWLDAANEPFTEPFFDETISKLISRRRAYSSTNSLSTLEMMKQWGSLLNDACPGAIIFHISRCGSTLISQMLSTSPKCTVLAEVPFLDDILRLPLKHTAIDETAVNSLFTVCLRFYNRDRNSTDSNNYDNRQLIIKADSWHIFFYRQLRQLYPETPFVLIYRKPNEVFRSHRKQPGLHSVPGLLEPQLFGIEPTDPLLSNHDAYLAHVLEGYLERYIDIISTDKRCLFLNYKEGPMRMVLKIAAFTNIGLTDADLAQMEERSYYHSKRPIERFEEEAVANIPDCLNSAMKLYDRLEQKRALLYQNLY